MNRDVVLDQARKFIPIIDRYNRDIRGNPRISDEADALLEEVIALNARYEFVWAKMAFEYAEIK